MAAIPDVLWLTVSPSLKMFDRPLLHSLSQQQVVAEWEYAQTPDEPNSLDTAIDLLHRYLQDCDRSIHLMGHSTGGLLGLLYAQRYPQRVKSLTLLSVGAYPAIDWQAFYYAHLQVLPCSRQMILMQMVHALFGHQPRCTAKRLVAALDQDLRKALSPHTLFRRASIAPQTVLMPLLVCGSHDDVVVTPPELQAWQHWFKEGDRLWECPGGHHFFHYFYPSAVSEQILDFHNALSVDQPVSHHLGSPRLSH